MKRRICAWFAAVALLVGIIPQFSFATAIDITELDLRRNQMSSNITYPDGIEYVKVHTAQADAHHFLLGAAVLKHGDVWICSYGQSMEKENDENSRFACRYSYDGGKTWGDEVEIAGVEAEGYCHSHGVLFEYNGQVWAFAPRAKFAASETYDSLTMEAFTLNKDMSWKSEGIVLEQSFWPLCEPMVLGNGDVLISGLYGLNGAAIPAVAVSKGDLTEWEMITVPNDSGLNLWGETSVIDYGDRLVAFIRTNSGTAAVSESTDYG